MYVIWCNVRHNYSQERQYYVEMSRICIELEICLEEDILTLLVYWNHIDENY